MVMLAALPEMVALPADTTPPAGSAWLFDANASITDSAKPFRTKRGRLGDSPADGSDDVPAVATQDDFLPRLAVVSAAATKVLLVSFQIDL